MHAAFEGGAARVGEHILVDGSILAEDSLFRDWAGDGTPVMCFRMRDDKGTANHPTRRILLKAAAASLGVVALPARAGVDMRPLLFGTTPVILDEQGQFALGYYHQRQDGVEQA